MDVDAKSVINRLKIILSDQIVDVVIKDIYIQQLEAKIAMLEKVQEKSNAVDETV